MSTYELSPVGKPLPPNAASPAVPSRPPLNEVVREKPEVRREPVKESLSREETQKEIEQINQVLDSVGHRLKFGFYEGTDQFYVQVIDRGRDQIIKMMPPEYLLSLRARLVEAVGLILDEVK